MKSTQKILLILALSASLFVSGCGPGQLFGPTITPTPTLTPTPTVTPTATPTLTPTPIPDGTITGKVFLEGVNRPYSTSIALFAVQTKAQVAETTTDSQGVFTFEGVKPGDYVLSIFIPLPSPILASIPCKLTIGGEKGWGWSAGMKMVGASLSITSVTYESDPITVMGGQTEYDLTLKCK